MSNDNKILFNPDNLSHVEKRSSVSDLQGNVLYDYALKSKGNILEIGSYRGRSTIILAQALQKRGNGLLFSVDPQNEKESSHTLFISNLKKAGVDKTVIPLRKYSHEVFREYKNYGINDVGFIFIDGNHSYKAVLLDIRWFSVLNKGGFMFFHDYGDSKIPDVKTAVNRRLRKYFK